eukprot:2520637-Lingulodinium_polyedra.AAC.1
MQPLGVCGWRPSEFWRAQGQGYARKQSNAKHDECFGEPPAYAFSPRFGGHGGGMREVRRLCLSKSRDSSR